MLTPGSPGIDGIVRLVLIPGSSGIGYVRCWLKVRWNAGLDPQPHRRRGQGNDWRE